MEQSRYVNALGIALIAIQTPEYVPLPVAERTFLQQQLIDIWPVRIVGEKIHSASVGENKKRIFVHFKRETGPVFTVGSRGAIHPGLDMKASKIRPILLPALVTDSRRSAVP